MMKAKNLQVQKWLNTPPDFTFDVSSRKIKIIHAFQMLCPGCVYHGIPQLVELHQLLQSEPVDIIGLHTVFEHHEVMTPQALEVFISEWRLPFPVGIDMPGTNHRLPETMRAYDMQGTPTLIIIDQTGTLRLQHFGHITTEAVLNFIKQLINEAKSA